MRVLGVDDGSFKPKQSGRTLLACVLMEGFRVAQVFFEFIEIDGLDATEKLIKVVKEGKEVVDLIMLSGISFAGFNLIDPVEVWERTSIPVIIATKDRPNNEAVRMALLKHFADYEARWTIFEKIGEVYEVKSNPKENPIWVEVVGIKIDEASNIIRGLTVFGRLPEPLRTASLIAKGLSKPKQLLPN